MSQITERITSFHDWPAPESFDALKRFLAHFHYGPVKWTEDPKAWPNDAYPTDTDGTIEELNGCYARGLLTDEQYLEVNAAIYDVRRSLRLSAEPSSNDPLPS